MTAKLLEFQLGVHRFFRGHEAQKVHWFFSKFLPIGEFVEASCWFIGRLLKTGHRVRCQESIESFFELFLPINSFYLQLPIEVLDELQELLQFAVHQIMLEYQHVKCALWLLTPVSVLPKSLKSIWVFCWFIKYHWGRNRYKISWSYDELHWQLSL